MNVINNEMVSVRDFRRNSAKLLEALRKKRREKIVLTRHGEMVGVIVSVESYEQMEKE